MATGFTATFDYSAASSAVDGDSYITFTETFSFEGTPSGTTLYLTDTASDVSAGIVEREMWTSRGAGVQTDVTNTVNGWTTGVQTTDTAGGSAVEWYTKQLTGFTLSGRIDANLRATQASGIGNSSLRAEIARVDADGSNASVWGSWCFDPTVYGDHEIKSPPDTLNLPVRISGDDLAISNGQRLRLRILLDDLPNNAMVSGTTVTTYYAGTSGGASGDAFLTLTETITEFVATARVPRFTPMPQLLAH